MRNTSKILLLEKTNGLFEQLSKLLSLIIIVSIFVPFAPKMPSPGIDASWALGLNQAVAQGLAFGKEIIFTLGPYSSIYTKQYHPATDFMMIAGSLYLAISYGISLLYLMRNIRWYWILMFCVPLFVMLYARDSLFFSYPLIVGLISFKMISLENRLAREKGIPLFVFLLFAPFGLFPLIKGSMLILCLLITILCGAFFFINRKLNLALLSIAAPIISMVLFWVAAGQSITYLPYYLLNSISIAASFTEAMSLDGNIKEVILYLLTSLCIFLAILWQKHIMPNAKIFLLIIFFIFLFVSFKTGFTRHLGHAFIPGTSILLAALFLPLIINSSISYLLILLSLHSWHYINGHYTHISIRNNFVSSYSATWHGIKSRIQDPFWLEKNFTFTMSFLRTQAAFPILDGTTDIYSYNQSRLIASQNTWLPRPIFQSYSVFASDLAENNANHLQGKHRPDNIIFKIEPIDGRVPALEDGASWPLLLANYQPIDLIDDFLFLRKKENFFKATKKLVRNEQHVFGELVHLEKQKQPLFVEIIVKPTLLGGLATIFYKPEQLQITFNLQNGTTKQYRLIASMAKSNFLISPLVENTSEFLLLYKKNNDLSAKSVKSFVITANQNKSWYWNNAYIISFNHTELRHPEHRTTSSRAKRRIS